MTYKLTNQLFLQYKTNPISQSDLLLVFKSHEEQKLINQKSFL